MTAQFRRRAAGVGVLAAAMLSAAASAGEVSTQRVFRVHALGAADGAAVVEMASAMVADGGRVTLDARHNRLLVFATEAEHARVASLAQAVAAPAPMVAIEVRRQESSAARDRRAEVGAGGAVSIGRGPAASGAAVRAEASSRTSRAADRSVQTLTVSSGRSASIEVGERIPYPAWWRALAIEWGLWSGEVAWHAVGSFLAVEPTVIGDGPGRRIHIRLTPELSVAADGGPFRIRFARLATDVVVAPGETVRLGGVSTDREFNHRFLLGGASGGEGYSVTFELTARLVEPPAQ